MEESDESDLIVGIPSYNEADSISHIVKQVSIGLRKYFSKLKCKIVNADNNSPDNTKKAFLKTKTKTEKVYITTPPRVKGKGNNVYNLFKYAVKTKAKALVIVDADLKSITPEWIKKLATPILNGTDFVAPLYIRHKYDGTITNNIAFPLVYSLFNKYIRQPIGGDFAVSASLIKYCLKQEWNETTRQFGIDIFITMNALIGNFSIEQVLLGMKIHKPSAPKLNEMFIQVVNTLFSLVTSNKKILNSINCKRAKTESKLPNTNPPDLTIDTQDMKNKSIENFKEDKELLKKILSPELFHRIEKTFTENKIYINSDLWSDIVFEFLKVYETYPNKIKLIEALRSLYFATTYTFINQTTNISSPKAEKLIVKQAEKFWNKRSRFLKLPMQPHLKI